MENSDYVRRFNKGDLVQMTAYGIKHQRKSLVKKTRETKGEVLGAAGTKDGHKYMRVRWYTGEVFPAYFTLETREDFLEPYGDPR